MRFFSRDEKLKRWQADEHGDAKPGEPIIGAGVMPAGLSRAVTVHHAHFTVDFVVALRFAKDGIRICLRRLFCVRAARKQQPGRNENHKRSRKHVSHLDLLHTQVNLDPRSLIPAGDDSRHCLLSIARRQRNG
jgi:hypothetical protein